MKKVRFTFLWSVTFLAVLIFSFAGNHHHHGTRVCLTYAHERTCDASHRHGACADAAGRNGQWEDAGTAHSDACHRHCTTRICSADRYAAVSVSRPKLPGKSYSWDLGGAFQALFPTGSSEWFPVTVVSVLHFPEPDVRLRLFTGLTGSLRAPPVC